MVVWVVYCWLCPDNTGDDLHGGMGSLLLALS